MRHLILYLFLLCGAVRCSAGTEDMQDIHGIAKAIDAYCDEERENRSGKSAWSPCTYRLETPIIPGSPLFGISYDSTHPICVAFYRQYTEYSQDGDRRIIIDLYSDQQWMELCDAMEEYHKNWLSDRVSDAQDLRDTRDVLPVAFSRQQIPKALECLVTKGFHIPAEKFRARWKKVIVGEGT